MGNDDVKTVAQELEELISVRLQDAAEVHDSDDGGDAEEGGEDDDDKEGGEDEPGAEGDVSMKVDEKRLNATPASAGRLSALDG